MEYRQQEGVSRVAVNATNDSTKFEDESTSLALSREEHESAFEWPGSAVSGDAFGIDSSRLYTSTSSPIPPFSSTPTLRLLVLRSLTLPRKSSLAIISGYKQVEFGRDVQPPGANTPRIRLKEMAVSKIHATVFYDTQRKEWAVVDMGSKHGTFLNVQYVDELEHGAGDLPLGVRLSPPKAASAPRGVKHSSLLTIGSTTFQVHIHDDGLSCERCVLNANEEIPLFPTFKPKPLIQETQKRPREEGPVDLNSRDAKKALSMLKRSLLSQHVRTRSTSSECDSGRQNLYVDRSARRRAQHPGSRSDTPGVTPNPPLISAVQAELVSTQPTKLPEPVQPPEPLSDTNVGHRLLLKQGWLPGTSLGLDDEGLIAPIDANASIKRAGLGSKSILSSREVWENRWNALQ